jgi:uncharacterized protein DUF4288
VHKRASSKWYAVKSILRLAPMGKPSGRDGAYDPQASLIEERVVLFRARSHEEALARAEQEARRYSRQPSHRNPYGQRVRYRLLPGADSYELFDPPTSGREIYSRTEMVSQSVSDESVLRSLIGAIETPEVHESRRNILDITFDKPAPGVRRSRAELAFLARGARRLGRP